MVLRYNKTNSDWCIQSSLKIYLPLVCKVCPRPSA